MDKVLHKLAVVKQGLQYEAQLGSFAGVCKVTERNKDQEMTEEGHFAEAVMATWNYVGILEKFDEDKEEEGTLPAVLFGPGSKALLGYIDLNSLEVLDRETGIKRFSELAEGESGRPESEVGDEYSGQPIVPCSHPVGFFHMTIVLHPEQNLPQLIGPEVLEDIFLIAGIFLPQTGAVLGFNSLNAGSPSNRLHLELLLSPSLGTPSTAISEEPGWPKTLPVIESKGEMLFMGNLAGPEDFSDYSTLVELSKSDDARGRFLKLEFKDQAIPEDGDEFDVAQVRSSILSFLISELVGLRVPHNIVWLNSGKTILVFPRKHSQQYSGWGWPEMVGLNRHQQGQLPLEECSLDGKQFHEVAEAFKAVLFQRLLSNTNECVLAGNECGWVVTFLCRVNEPN